MAVMYETEWESLKLTWCDLQSVAAAYEKCMEF